jgi:hypothetical protein
VIKEEMSLSKPHYTGMFTRSMRPQLLRDLPRDWLIQVMDCLPTKCLFQLMRTCKQWEAVSRYIIKYRKVLILKGPSNKDDPNLFVVGYGRDEDSYYQQIQTMRKMMISLMQMVNLHKIRVPDVFKSACRSLVDELIALNAGSLRDVKVEQMPHDETLVYPFLKKYDCENFDLSNAGQVFPKMEHLSIRFIDNDLSFNGDKTVMPHLKHLYLSDQESIDDWKNDDVFGYELDDGPFVMAHSASLVSLQCIKLRSNELVSFPKLKKLIIAKLPQNVTFPALEELRVYSATRPELFSHLPLMKMRELKVGFDFNVTRDDEIEVCKAVSQMVNLTDLKLELQFGYTPGAEFPDIFKDMHQLVSVSLQTDGEIAEDCMIRKWVQPLLHNNPHLEKVKLNGIPVTDDDLTLCSKLSNLQHLLVTCGGFSISGVRAFMWGSSRNVIRKLYLAYDDSVTDKKFIKQLDKEIKCLEKERGVIFKRKRYGDPAIEYKLSSESEDESDSD